MQERRGKNLKSPINPVSSEGALTFQMELQHPGEPRGTYGEPRGTYGEPRGTYGEPYIKDSSKNLSVTVTRTKKTRTIRKVRMGTL